ncbi:MULTISPECIES: hypothetical protein [unclassified Thioalkalivibrio]|uniref:hypothetical protein n=1 Tax=unclassified Thioalkalivibrio TaxID=2621013 RepID=UPI000375A0BE|nr:MULTISPECIES: hypothetical protein [unclassified Thioalkalivibrio]
MSHLVITSWVTRGAFLGAWLTGVATLLGARPVDDPDNPLLWPPVTTLVIEETVLAELARTCPVEGGPMAAGGSA